MASSPSHAARCRWRSSARKIMAAGSARKPNAPAGSSAATTHAPRCSCATSRSCARTGWRSSQVPSSRSCRERTPPHRRRRHWQEHAGARARGRVALGPRPDRGSCQHEAIGVVAARFLPGRFAASRRELSGRRRQPQRGRDQRRIAEGRSRPSRRSPRRGRAIRTDPLERGKAASRLRARLPYAPGHCRARRGHRGARFTEPGPTDEALDARAERCNRRQRRPSSPVAAFHNRTVVLSSGVWGATLASDVRHRPEPDRVDLLREPGAKRRRPLPLAAAAQHVRASGPSKDKGVADTWVRKVDEATLVVFERAPKPRAAVVGD